VPVKPLGRCNALADASETYVFAESAYNADCGPVTADSSACTQNIKEQVIMHSAIFPQTSADFSHAYSMGHRVNKHV
jgi:hypothetical protein